jgi:hypothetical protein
MKASASSCLYSCLPYAFCPAPCGLESQLLQQAGTWNLTLDDQTPDSVTPTAAQWDHGRWYRPQLLSGRDRCYALALAAAECFLLIGLRCCIPCDVIHQQGSSSTSVVRPGD